MCLMNSQAERPSTVVWELVRSSATLPPVVPGSDLARQAGLSFSQCQTLLGQIREAGPRVLQLTGSDLSRRQDLLRIVKQAADGGHVVTLRSGVAPGLLSLNFQQLREAGAGRFSLPIQGGDPLSQDEQTGLEGSWDLTMAIAAMARRARLPIELRTTFCRENLDQWPELVTLVNRLQPVLWTISLRMPSSHERSERALSSLSTETLLRAIATLPRTMRVPVQVNDAPHLQRVVQQTLPEGGISYDTPTNDGRGRLFISHRGEIQPGSHLPIACGHVASHHLLEVYREAPVFRRLRDSGMIKGKCHHCEFRSVCGGSRARAYVATGDYLASDPACIYRPAAIGRRFQHH